MSKPPYIISEVPENLGTYLRKQNWLNADESILHAEKAGEGNMNLVLRVVTNQRSLIIKQARPWVEKYPHIEAPQNRALMEARFYEMTQYVPFLRSHSPALFWKDEENYVLLLEDLGEASDMTGLYQPDTSIGKSDLLTLTRYLFELHNRVNLRRDGNAILNRDMRKLNHHHIFVFPFETENGFNLDDIQPGLESVAAPYKNDSNLKSEIAKLGEIYLADGDVLLHGDFYPGSWLKTLAGIKVIDPEFCFFGPREFDAGVMVAHLKLAKQPEELIQLVFENYSCNLNKSLLSAFAGIEIIRRLLGVAQLPLALTLQEKRILLKEACSMVMVPAMNLVS